MTDTWQSILTQQASLDNSANHKQQQFMPLPQLGVLQIEGEDAQSFLQNLLTNDVNALAINQGQLSGFCNTKGRLFATFLLVRRDDGYQIILPKAMGQSLQQRLTMYVLRSKVTIVDISDNTACIGLYQTKSEPISGLNFPTENYQCSTEDSNLVLKLPSPQSRYLVFSPLEKVDALLTNLSEHAQLVNQSIWQRLDIEAGLPMIYPESKEKFTPQQVNFDLVGGVSFSKGCYPGQEIVARLHYLGTPSRRMFAAEAQTNEFAEIGSEITNADGNIAGHVVSAQQPDTNTLKLLISLKLAELESDLFVNQDTKITVDPQLTE